MICINVVFTGYSCLEETHVVLSDDTYHVFPCSLCLSNASSNLNRGLPTIRLPSRRIEMACVGWRFEWLSHRSSTYLPRKCSLYLSSASSPRNLVCFRGGITWYSGPVEAKPWYLLVAVTPTMMLGELPYLYLYLPREMFPKLEQRVIPRNLECFRDGITWYRRPGWSETLILAAVTPTMMLEELPYLY